MMEKRTEKMKMADVRLNYTRLGEVLREKKLFNGEVNMAIAKNNMALESHMKCFEENIKMLVERFALKDENGNPMVKGNKYIFGSKEDEDNYLRAAGELEDIEIEIDIQKVRYDNLTDEKHDEPTAYDLVSMSFMLED